LRKAKHSPEPLLLRGYRNIHDVSKYADRISADFIHLRQDICAPEGDDSLRSLFVSAVLISIACIGSLPSSAQNRIPPRLEGGPEGMPLSRGRAGQADMIQSTISFTIPFDEGQPIEPQQEEAMKSLYRMAGRSCDWALGTVATKCAIQSLSANVRVEAVGRNVDSRGNSRLTVTGQVAMAVEFISATAP
jgi:hypothetical protein